MRKPAILALAVVMLLGMPRQVRGMTSDGAMITNYASVTGYWGLAGPAYTSRFTMSFNVTAGAIVSNPVILAQKTVTPTIMNAGGTLTFSVCVVNLSLQCSSWNVVVQEKLADSVAYVNLSMTSWVPAGSSWNLSDSGNGTTWAAEPAEPPAGQTSPFFMRWALDKLGPGTSASVTFRAVVQ
ncbi:MAG: hypothetical protein AAB152_18650 [Candidatus Coatesbacteria bacterium]